MGLDLIWLPEICWRLTASMEDLTRDETSPEILCPSVLLTKALGAECMHLKE